jgi:hypothetical protein
MEKRGPGANLTIVSYNARVVKKLQRGKLLAAFFEKIIPILKVL